MKYHIHCFIPAVLLICLALAGCTLRTPAGRMDASQNIVPFSVQKFDSIKAVQYPWGWIRWLMSAELDPKATQTFGIVQIEAGQRNYYHKHPNCEELVYVLSGTIEHVTGDQRVVLHEGDIIRIPANVPHQSINHTNAPVRTVVVYNTGTRQMVTLDPQAK